MCEGRVRGDEESEGLMLAEVLSAAPVPEEERWPLLM